jgi:mRNA-degrading endonuclease RelE of RelBE toxin-antitoxin system
VVLCFIPRVRYDLRFSEEARAHLRQLAARERRIVLDAALAALSHEPEKETRNLKVLRRNPIAKYELRIGDLRVFFEVAVEAGEVWCSRSVARKGIGSGSGEGRLCSENACV